ncbi:hypothetical protein Taro_004928 [Colocasia esculenta]|uniref:Uncharacterized protein n=1 Tax=Colocasia esculenta TaxID=4460 RepID=A0A843TJK8_COLES|nr:hypothetical protein [Colocasia esculenta]
MEYQELAEFTLSYGGDAATVKEIGVRSEHCSKHNWQILLDGPKTTILFWAHYGPAQFGRQTWSRHQVPRRSKDGFEDLCSILADRYQQDLAIAFKHHPACSNKGPSFRTEYARFAPYALSAHTAPPYARPLTAR